MNDRPKWAEPSWNSEQRKHAGERYRGRNLNLSRLWTYYLGIGGDADEFALDGYLNGLLGLAPGQMRLVDTAIDELSADGQPGPVGQ